MLAISVGYFEFKPWIRSRQHFVALNGCGVTRALNELVLVLANAEPGRIAIDDDGSNSNRARVLRTHLRRGLGERDETRRGQTRG